MRSALPLFLPDRLPHSVGVSLQRLTKADDLVATETGWSPNVLYYADRRGWLLNREYSLERLEHLRQAGARYYADTFLDDANAQRGFFRRLNARFQRLTTEDAPWQIYDLAWPTQPLRTLADQEVQHARVVNFGDQIQFHGISLWRLLDWTSVFAVQYYRQCLKPPTADLRVFVHFTDSDAGPLAAGGGLPAPRWKAYRARAICACLTRFVKSKKISGSAGVAQPQSGTTSSYPGSW
jgi:hypothetical protein